MILISVRQNKTNAAVIIEGPEGVLISKDENKPIITDNKPPIIDNLTTVSYTHLRAHETQ